MQRLISELKNLDTDTINIIKYGLFFCFFIAFLASIILLIYIFLDFIFFYRLGITLMQSSFIFTVEFIICGIVVDFIRKQKI